MWLERPIESHIRLTGGMCAAVEANFLVGLIEASADLFPKIGARPLARLLSDFAARGTSDALDYVDDYLLVPISRLLVHQNDASDAAKPRAYFGDRKTGGGIVPTNRRLSGYGCIQSSRDGDRTVVLDRHPRSQSALRRRLGCRTYFGERIRWSS